MFRFSHPTDVSIALEFYQIILIMIHFHPLNTISNANANANYNFVFRLNEKPLIYFFQHFD